MASRNRWMDRLPFRLLPFRQGMIRGLAVIIPIVITLGVLWFLFDAVVGRFAQMLDALPLIRRLPYPILLLLSLAFLVGLVYFTGVWATSYVGRETLAWVNRVFLRIPLARAIYRASQEVFSILSQDTRQRFRPVLVPFPQEPLWAVGFLAQNKPVQIGDRAYYYVYLPTTPSPATGWSFLVPAEKVRFLHVSVEEALRWVVSGGLLFQGKLDWHEPEKRPAPDSPSQS